MQLNEEMLIKDNELSKLRSENLTYKDSNSELIKKLGSYEGELKKSSSQVFVLKQKIQEKDHEIEKESYRSKELDYEKMILSAKSDEKKYKKLEKEISEKCRNSQDENIKLRVELDRYREEIKTKDDELCLEIKNRKKLLTLYACLLESHTDGSL